MKNYFKKCLSFTLIFTLVHLPVLTQNAIANGFDDTCKDPLSRVEGGKGDGGDALLASCMQADLAREAKDLETAKSVLFLAAAVVCTVEAVIEDTGDGMEAVPYTAAEGAAMVAEAKAVCVVTSIASAAGGLAIDIGGKIWMNDTKEKYNQTKDQVCSVSTFIPLVMQVAPLLMTSASSGGGKGKNNGCIGCAIMNGLTGALSISQAVASSHAEDASVKTAAQIKDNTKSSVTNLSPPPTTNYTAPGANHGSSGGSAPQPAATKPSTTACGQQNGNQYLSCMGTMSPEIAALSNSSDFLGQMSKSLHGKNLGDFVKGYHGNSNADLASYVAAGMGVSTAAVAKVIENGNKMAKDTGFMDKYTPMAYKSSAGSAPKLGGEELDFSKMMSGLMGKMGAKDADGNVKDPSELVFRQLELLPADKIQANKDISLFARIAFRYRKSSNNLDQLNWSGQKNQTAAPQQKSSN